MNIFSTFDWLGDWFISVRNNILFPGIEIEMFSGVSFVLFPKELTETEQASDRVARTVYAIGIVLSTISTATVEGNVKFEVEIRENEQVIFFSFNFTNPLKSIHAHLGDKCTPG